MVLLNVLPSSLIGIGVTRSNYVFLLLVFFKHFYISAVINSAGAVFRGTKKSLVLLTLMLPKSYGSFLTIRVQRGEFCCPPGQQQFMAARAALLSLKRRVKRFFPSPLGRAVLAVETQAPGCFLVELNIYSWRARGRSGDPVRMGSKITLPNNLITEERVRELEFQKERE